MAENTTNSEEAPVIVKKIIKKGGHAGHHGGAWKVAYADFVTAMMCLFLLLWLVNVDPSAKSAIAAAFKQPTETGPMEGNMFIFGGAMNPGDPGKFEGGASFLQFEKLAVTAANKEEVKKQMQLELQKELEMSSDEELLDKIEFNLVEQGILIELKDSDTMEVFQSGSATLSTQATTIIDKLSHVLRTKLAPLILAGHTDSKQYGYGNYDNWNLASDRAMAIKQRLVYGGVSKTRFARVESYADTQLKNPNSPLSAANRRMTILLLQEGEAEKLRPTYLDANQELGKEVMRDKAKEAKLKANGEFNAGKYNSTGSKTEKPMSLEEMKRKKAREAYRKKYPGGGGAAEGGGHEAPAAEPEAAPAPAEGGHGGEGHGGH